MNRRSAAYLAIAVAFALASFGCAPKKVVTHKAETKLPKKVTSKVLVVPFSDAQSYYYDSQDGGAIADAAAAAIAACGEKITVLPYDKARGLIRGSFALNEPVNWKDVGEMTGADYIIHGNVDTITWLDQYTPDLPRCTFSVTYRVYDVKLGQQIYAVNKLGVYPVSLIGPWGAAGYAQGIEGLKPRAYIYIGRVVAGTLCTYPMDRREEESIVVRKAK